MFCFIQKIKRAELCPLLAPIFAVGVVAWGTAASLGGYAAPVYGADEFKIAADETGQMEATRESSGDSADEARAANDQNDNKKAPGSSQAEAGQEEKAVAKGNFDLADGSYEGSGPVKVSVKIQDKAITALDIVSHSDDEAFFNRAKEGVTQSILTSQSVEVDVVSGATYSSNGIISAVKDALGQGGSSTEAQAAGSGASAAASPTSAPVTVGQGNFDVADGSYEGSGDGFRGPVKVSVQVQSKTIQAVNILSHSDDESFFNRAKEGVVGKILSSQSLEVDAVSGATYSSRGIISAVKNALTGQAGASQTATPTPGQTSAPQNTPEPVKDPDAYKNGTYTGTGTGFGGEMTVQVKISGGKIKKIKILEHSDGDEYIQKASALLNRIVQTQGTNVDAVSGATYSSNGILQAVREALAKAATTKEKKKPAATATPTKTPSTPVPAATAAPAAPSGAFPYPDGTYTGVGEGYGGDIAVAVAIRNKAIKEIQVTSHDGEDDAFFNRARTLLDVIVQRQNIAVDAVSGATYSSQGLLEAVRNAIEAAKEAASPANPKPAETQKPAETPAPTPVPVETPAPTQTPEPETPSVYADGEYKATAPCEPDSYFDFDAYNLTLTLVMKNDVITEIKNISGDGWPDNDSYIKRAAQGSSAYKGVVAQILEKNSIEGVDAVTRATCSSHAILEACRQALEAARRQ